MNNNVTHNDHAECKILPEMILRTRQQGYHCCWSVSPLLYRGSAYENDLDSVFVDQHLQSNPIPREYPKLILSPTWKLWSRSRHTTPSRRFPTVIDQPDQQWCQLVERMAAFSRSCWICNCCKIRESELVYAFRFSQDYILYNIIIYYNIFIFIYIFIYKYLFIYKYNKYLLILFISIYTYIVYTYVHRNISGWHLCKFEKKIEYTIKLQLLTYINANFII